MAEIKRTGIPSPDKHMKNETLTHLWLECKLMVRMQTGTLESSLSVSWGVKNKPTV